MMTRKDFNAMARAISEAQTQTGAHLGELANTLADLMAHENPRFNRAMFLAAAGVKTCPHGDHPEACPEA